VSISETAKFVNEDLVLEVKPDYDPTSIRLDDFEPFLSALCGDREYQKDAIRDVCRLMAGGQYETTRDLARENYEATPVLADRYGSFEGMLETIPFHDKLSCAVDLATGTGKSWVIYGIARVLLAVGLVDRVLVLCPSLTIESGLRAKFAAFTTNKTLRDLMPDYSVFRNPEITDADSTTGPGDICVENIDATYRHVKTSVRDSFLGKGGTTLVLNDEAHHIYSPPTGQRAIKRWKEFLDDSDFGFRYIAGFSGTCYVGDKYFSDVVTRYSLRQAMEEGMVKRVQYVAEDESGSQEERFQKYLQQHHENQKKYPSVKPLSIVVTAKIDLAQSLATEFAKFLSDTTKVPLRQAEEQVLVVTSKHPEGVAKLPYVDRADDPTQWIFSVSMLTEGWDVQNVFQIIPHEKRAFNSKLLISQVLGRGLRTAGLSKPVVRVFNHSNWSKEIEGLVAEVLEQERRIHCYPVEGARADFHFDLHSLSYDTIRSEQALKLKNGNGQLKLFKKGFINFETQDPELERRTVFKGALDQTQYVMTTKVRHYAHSIDDVVRHLRARLKSVDAEGKTEYAKDYPPKRLRAILEKSLERIGETRGLISEQNLQHALRAIGTIHRAEAKAVRIELNPKQLFVISTRAMRERSAGFGSFRKEATVFYDSESAGLSDDMDRRALQEIIDDPGLPKWSSEGIANKYWFKSPVNVVLTTHGPERGFVRRLFEQKPSDQIAGWVKSPDVGFYEIRYTFRKGDHSIQRTFNPDFFIKLKKGKDVLAVELKADDDDSDENRAKYRFAAEHFERVNKEQSEARYHILFLSPNSFDQFFQKLREGTAASFVSNLQAKLAG
jgi:type III restriction enzyme